jgi:hypothetical protein
MAAAFDGSFDAALDAALTMALPAPALPGDFRERLRAALARADGTKSVDMQRAQLEREHRQGLAELKSGYLRLLRRTLIALIGGACALGAGVALLFPWLSAAMGVHAVAGLAVFGGIAGLAIGVDASRGRQESLTI